ITRLVVLAAFLLVTACAGLPTGSRTGMISVVTITDDMVSPRDVVVQPGDEVKIVNRRGKPAWVYFTREHVNELSCERGFSYFWGIEESAKIKPNQSASVCFTKPGLYGYSVQAQPTVLGGARLGELSMPPATPAAVIVEPVR
ncbi:MAG: hypothetical protein ACREJU_02830, partial [Nitrospiraceae bacterium]